LIRLSARLAGASLLAVLFSSALTAIAQDQAPASPTPETASPTPAAPAAAAPVFPKPDPADFTAATPTKEVVNAFMQANLGFDQNAMWQVQAIQKTQIPNISKVVVFVGDIARSFSSVPTVPIAALLQRISCSLNLLTSSARTARQRRPIWISS